MKFKIFLKILSFFFLFVSCDDVSIQSQCESSLASTSIIGPLDWIKFDETGDFPQNANELAVAQIKIPASIASCTGFLINENTIMTNNHCISSAAKAINVTAIFRSESGERTSFACDEFITTNYKYDFSLVKCKGKPGKDFGWVGLSRQRSDEYSKIYLVQENCNYIGDPRCLINKYVSFGDVLGSQTTRIYHDADTLPGSSGSPIFLQGTHQVVAIHNAGSVRSDGSKAKNGGVPMYQIRKLIEDSTDVIIHEFGSAGEYPTDSGKPVDREPVETENGNGDCNS